MRAIDKRDKFDRAEVKLLLTVGRKDASGDFTKGAGLSEHQAEQVLKATEGEFSRPDEVRLVLQSEIRHPDELYILNRRQFFSDQPIFIEALNELDEMRKLFAAAGYGADRIRIDPSVVRGLEYYTGPVFEAELTFEVKGDDGQPVRFGSVGGGGRYDDLVARFTGQKVPATGFSIGVSRLQAALAVIGEKTTQALGPVVVLVMDKAEIASYQKMVKTLRDAGVRAEMYLGSSGMKAQMKYADKRNSPCVIIQGSDERAKGEVTLKDLIEGAKAAAAIKDNKEWKAARPAQLAVPEADLVDEVRKIIDRYAGS